MPEMKSAWQIAAERTERLGSLSREEQRRLKDQEYTTIGSGLAGRFLSSCDDRQMTIQIEKYGGEARQSIRKAALRALAEAIDLNARSRFDTVRTGINRLYPNGEFAGLLDEASSVFDRYGQVEASLRSEVDEEGRELLHRLRISGNAVREIEIRARPEWQQKLDDMARPLTGELDGLKRQLMAAA